MSTLWMVVAEYEDGTWADDEPIIADTKDEAIELATKRWATENGLLPADFDCDLVLYRCHEVQTLSIGRAGAGLLTWEHQAGHGCFEPGEDTEP